MPKIFGTSLFGVLAATIAFYIVGVLWYEFLFQEAWMSATGMTQETVEAQNAKLGPLMYVGGLIVTFMQVIGLTYILNQSGASTLKNCAKICGVIAALIGLPLMCYAILYEGRSISGLYINASHIFVGYIITGVVLSFFRIKYD